MTYGFADVGRAGLANMLLPWARCEVFCRKHGLRMLAPQWTQPRIGPLLRREKDKRYYFGLFKDDGYVSGPRRWWLLAISARVGEANLISTDRQLLNSDNTGLQDHSTTVVVFQGLGRYFADLAGEEDFLRGRLKQILSEGCAEQLRRSLGRDAFHRVPDFLKDGDAVERVPAEADSPAAMPAIPGQFIAVHIRRGDKPPLAPGEEPPRDSMHWAIPTEWYVRCVSQVKSALGNGVPALVFTDADAEQIAPVLNLPGVRLAEPNPAIVDMLLMAEARVLITTASSTFSMWPSFLGRMPSVWFPARWREQTNFSRPEFECCTDLEGNLPESFLCLHSH